MPTLTAPPSLLPLYAKAAATAALHRGATLPDSVYQLDARAIDTGHLAEYDRVCGFRYGEALPPTYLHVLAFPLQVALMCERAFPFPLVGLVHVGNEITVHRPVAVAERIALTVRAQNLRPHPAGRQFELISQASVGGETVWSGRSTYLRRAGRPQQAGAHRPRPVADVPAGASTLLRVPGDIGRRYAAVSGDRNPIHLSGLTAKAFGFPSAIAHGMWLKARTLATLEGRLPDSYTVRVSFKTPLLLPSTVSIVTARVTGPHGEATAGAAWTLDVRNARNAKPHLRGTLTPG